MPITRAGGCVQPPGWETRPRGHGVEDDDDNANQLNALRDMPRAARADRADAELHLPQWGLAKQL